MESVAAIPTTAAAAATTGASSSSTESTSNREAKAPGKNSDEENPTAVALRKYFGSKGVSPEDIETTIKVLNAVSGLSHKNSCHKRKHIGSVSNSNKKRKNNSDACDDEKKDDRDPNNNRKSGTDDSRSKAEAAKTTADELLNEYRTSKGMRPLRKALIQCYNKVVKTAMFDGHSSIESFRNHKESLTQSKKRKMADNSQQRKHIANTLLRKGRIEKLNAKFQEGQEEERLKFERLKLTMVPDGHVDTGPTPTSRPQLTNGIDATATNTTATTADAMANDDITGKDNSKAPTISNATKSNLPTVTTVEDEEQSQPILPNLRSCYVCKSRFRILHHFYDQLCPDCASLNWTNRHKSRDLTGKVAVVTGSRVKIGYQTCLKLLRAGCHVIATTRFPNSAVDSYRREPDFDKWKDNLEIYGLDLRDVTGLELFCRYLHHKLGGGIGDADEIKQPVGLDILINNACQTIRRPVAYYLPACRKEQELWRDADETHKGLLKGCMEYERLRRRLHLTSGASSSTTTTLGSSATAAIGSGSMTVPRLEPNPTSSVPNPVSDNNATLADSTSSDNTTPSTDKSTSLTTTPGGSSATPFETTGMSHSAASSQMILCPEDVGVDDSILPEGLSDINGQQLDLRKTNSWLLKMDQVSTPELMECMFVNAIAPFVLNSRLQPLLTKRRNGDEMCNRFVVNVSAMEGKFYRYKMANHPHTNMAKSALNMMTRTAAEDLAKNHGVYMNSIDTGWINDENPLERAAKTARVNNFQTPIDEIDAASRLVDPIFSDSKVYGKFLKDYRETEW